MSDYPSDLRYTRDHAWVRTENGDILTVGITSYAADQLAHVTFVGLPKVDDTLDDEDSFGSIESVEAVSDVYVPTGGTITTVNEAVSDDPELVNTDSYGEGWLVRLRPNDAKAYDGLMTAAEYEAFVKAEAE
jgi:glycine cleavage system H protein